MPFTRKASLVALAFALLLLALLFSSLEARADALAITGGSYTLTSPFRTDPRYISFNFNLQGNNFRAAGGEGDGTSQRVGSNCVFPCVAGSTFSLSSSNRLLTASPTSLLQLDGVSRNGWFSNSALQFNTDGVTIPLDAGPELSLSVSFTMSGLVGFNEFNLQAGALTGYTFTSEIFGSGIAQISLAFSQISHQYEILRVQYNFQPAPVPEPATLLLLGTGLAGAAVRRRRRRSKV